MCLEKALHSGPTLPLSIQDLGEKIIATLDENKSCDIAEATRNDATVNVCRNQRLRRSNEIIVCDQLFWWQFFRGGAGGQDVYILVATQNKMMNLKMKITCLL